jgi:hypothetical protein
MAEPRPRRRRFVLSLRALLLVILVAALWLGSWVNRSRNQQAAVLAVQSSPYFANVIYDDDVDYFPQETPWSRHVGRKVRSWVPRWVQANLGKDYFDPALAIAFSREDSAGPASNREVFRKLGLVRSLDQLNPNVEVVDADVERIAGLPNLKRLELLADCPRLTDASLRTLAGMPRLEALGIFNAPITDAGLSQFKGLHGLKSLVLGEAKPFDTGATRIAIDGSGFAELASLPDFTELEFHSQAITSEGLKHLGTLKHLKRLRLKGRSITDDDLRCLASLRHLESLEIVGSKIDGTGFKHLLGLSKLSYVCLEGPNITDAAVPFLAQLPALESVMIYGTKVTASGLEGFRGSPRLRQMGLIPAAPGDKKRLKQALPGCAIVDGGNVL